MYTCWDLSAGGRGGFITLVYDLKGQYRELRLYLIYSDFQTKSLRRNRLEIEVNSGRSYFLFFVSGVLLFQPIWILLPGLILVVIISTYNRRLILGRNERDVRIVSRIMWITFIDELVARSTMVDIKVKTIRDGDDGTWCLVADLRLKDQREKQLFTYPNSQRAMEFVQVVSEALGLEVVRDLPAE